MKKLLIGILSLCSIGIVAQTSINKTKIDALNAAKTQAEVSIHDPSIVYNESDKTYYIVGSHRGLGKSTDLVDWTSIDNGKWVIAPNWWENYQDGSYLFNKPIWQAFKSNPTHEVTLADGSTGTLGSFDASAFCAIYDANGDSAHIIGNMWAPDVIYNKAMKKWCYYLSLNGDNWASVIVLMTGNSPVGPFTYQGPIVFGGFNNQSYGGKKVNYKDTDLELVLGTLSSLPARYNTTKWGTYYPNCIDPNVFYDEDGELWLIYGSWSGGIYSLKLDKNTGLRDYTVKYSGTGTSPNTGDDAYFGKKIAGGYYSSGEGPYIRHIGNYYYLFMSYGYFESDGGYEMRIFRSDSPTGPFKDASGNLATYTSYAMNYGPKSTTNRGMKLIGAYNEWGNMTTGECAQGHNSAIIGADGEAYVVFHTKFNDGTDNEGHQVRIHRLYVNENGWLVTSPFRYTGSTNSTAGINTTTQKEVETTQPFTAEQLAGTYHLMIHPYKLDYVRKQESLEMPVTLTADGKITGEKTGTWTYSQDGKSYIKLVIGGVTYYGVVCQQGINGGCKNAVSITTVSNTGVPAWLYKQEAQSAIATNYTNFIDYAGAVTQSNKDVTRSAPEMLENATLEYTSANTDVIANDGTIYPQAEDMKVAITPANISCGDYTFKYSSFSKKYLTVKAGDAESNAVAFYPLNALDNTNYYNPSQQMTAYKSGTATMPRIDEDSERGNVLHQFKTADTNNSSYVRMPNPLYNSSAEEFTVNFWVKPISPRSIWGAYFSFFEGASPTASGGRFYITDNSYIGYNGKAGWFDINKPDTVTYYDIPMGEWSMVTLTATSDGIKFYVNGYPHAPKLWNSGTAATESDFNYAGMLSDINSYPYMYLGTGSWWGSAGCYLSELKVFDRSLGESDIQALRAQNGLPISIRGDANGDGEVGMPDVMFIVNYTLGTPATTFNKRAADANHDGEINMSDAMFIVQYILSGKFPE